ncbi:hypothetical protein [Mycoplasmopsis cricetuli]|uniref:hypothetical protein n=1 Tax=Mycoplasmopsis cricetuli TaxID=171283 RepID=UPI001B7FA720|nr:hypothetical protein [Mycoplasmopsis cricetuli]
MVLRTKWSTKISFMILTFSTILIQPLQSITYVIENQSYYFLEDLDSLEKNDLVLTSKFVNKKNNNYQLFIVPKTKNLNLNDDKKSFLDKEKKLIKKAGNNFYILSFFLKFLNPSHEFLFSVQRDYDGKNVFQNFNSNSNINKINDKYWNVFLSQSEEKPPTGKNEIFSLNYIKEKNMLIPGRYFFDVKDDSKKIFENNLKIDIEKFYKVWKNVFNSQSVKNVNDFENAKEIFTKTIEENNFGKIFNKNEFFIATLVFLYENYSENNFLKIFISGILKNNNEIKIKENKFDISKFNFPYSHFKNYPNEKIDIFKNVDEIFVYSQKSFDLIKILILFVFSLSVLFIFITYFSYLKKDNF